MTSGREGAQIGDFWRAGKRGVYRHGYAPPGKQKSDWDGPVAEEALTGDGSRHGLTGTLVPHSCWKIPPGMSTFE